MASQEIIIDVTSLARQAFRERRPAEELDNTLLRVAKDHYGKSGPVVFEAISAARRVVAARKNVSMEEALRQLMENHQSMSLITCPRATGAKEP